MRRFFPEFVEQFQEIDRKRLCKHGIIERPNALAPPRLGFGGNLRAKGPGWSRDKIARVRHG